jgi:orotidine-5'-phosphate decarboxylase
MNRDNSGRLIVALDVEDLDSALSMTTLLRGSVDYFKVGLSLFTKVGPAGIRKLLDQGIRLFLDLKFHDIPAVVGEASANAAAMGVHMITVHASGGVRMMAAAAEGARSAGGSGPVVLGVTVLTSLDADDLTALGYPGTVEARVAGWGELARKSGLGGLVSSARETEMLRRLMGPSFTLVTPGIRPAGAALGDQKRVVTPAEALEAGADYLVVGRPITGAEDPRAAALAVLAEMRTGSAG